MDESVIENSDVLPDAEAVPEETETVVQNISIDFPSSMSLDPGQFSELLAKQDEILTQEQLQVEKLNGCYLLLLVLVVLELRKVVFRLVTKIGGGIANVR